MSKCHYSTTNSTATSLEWNTRHNFERPATNRLRHGTVNHRGIWQKIVTYSCRHINVYGRE